MLGLDHSRRLLYHFSFHTLRLRSTSCLHPYFHGFLHQTTKAYLSSTWFECCKQHPEMKTASISYFYYLFVRYGCGFEWLWFLLVLYLLQLLNLYFFKFLLDVYIGGKQRYGNDTNKEELCYVSSLPPYCSFFLHK